MTASSADRLRSRLEAEGLAPGAWSNGPGDVYGAHDHDFDKILVCASGSITFGVGDGSDGGPDHAYELREGDRLELPAGTRHHAQVGLAGVTCLEGHLPRGRLAALRHRPAGGW